jgi:carbon monoxide dehydrogenase subunit G
MELSNEFRVGVPVEQAWSVLTDVERIAPCMPGAELQEVEGDEYRGVVKIKVGPITAQYKGKATFVEKDDAAHRAVLRAEGRDTRGAGNANATITASLTEDGDGTRVRVVTDLAVTGKVAQFGRGVLADVSTKLLNQFVTCLETTVLVPEVPAATLASDAPGEPAPIPEAPRPAPAPAQPVDLLDIAGGSMAKRFAPVLGALFAVWLFVRRRRRHRKG